MKKILTVTSVLLAAMTSVAFAAAPKHAMKHMSMAKTMKCPACHMPMPTKKSAATPVPVKIGKTTYYCCSGCAAGKQAMAMMKHSKKM